MEEGPGAQELTMNCEKFEPMLLDELYGELDEVTSAAVKRHVASCSRCAGLLNGMRATRRAATSALSMTEVPAGLEDRILSAVASTPPPVQPGRAAHVLSWAGRWAMRPQTAMAAVFLLMIGTSAFVIRSRRSEPAFAVSVTENGEPSVAASAVADYESLDNKAAAAAHGAGTPAAIGRPASPAMPVPTVAAKSAAESEEGALAARGSVGSGTRARDLQGVDGDDEAKLARSEIANAAGPAGAPEPPSDLAPSQKGAPAKRSQAQDSFSAGMSAYRSRDFGEAVRQFDEAAKSGDQNAALWAAKSVRDGSGCAAAIGRFDAVASKSNGTWLGNEATLESARCQIATGQLDSARTKLTKLTHVTSHATAAQQALAELDQVAARRSTGQQKGGAAGRAATAAPAPRPAAAAPRTPSADDP